MSEGMQQLRIISLLPSATEIIFALGAGSHVVGVTHECDFPEAARNLTHCTGNLLPSGLTAREIDNAVSAALKEDTHSIYSLNTYIVRELRPSVIVTQSLCAVCAVPEKRVRELSCTLPDDCFVVSSDPHTLPELFDSIIHIGKAIGYEASAKRLVAHLNGRLEKVQTVVKLQKPRVAVLEWPDPVYEPGHWIPDMIGCSGGECVLGESGQQSKRVTTRTLVDAQPDVVICAFCGYDLKDNELECDKVRNTDYWKALMTHAQVYATNASALFSRPGNRLIDGTELLAYILHRTPRYKPKVGSGSLLISEQWRDLSQM